MKKIVKSYYIVINLSPFNLMRFFHYKNNVENSRKFTFNLVKSKDVLHYVARL